MPKSQLEVMSMDWERSQAWLSVTLLPPSLWEPDPVDPQLLPGTRASWHFSKSTSWSISTISHIPVSSLVTWDCLMCARIMAGLSKKAISSALYSLARSFGCFLSDAPSCLYARGSFSLPFSLFLKVSKQGLMTCGEPSFPFPFPDYFLCFVVGKVPESV